MSTKLKEIFLYDLESGKYAALGYPGIISQSEDYRQNNEIHHAKEWVEAEFLKRLEELVQTVTFFDTAPHNEPEFFLRGKLNHCGLSGCNGKYYTHTSVQLYKTAKFEVKMF